MKLIEKLDKVNIAFDALWASFSVQERHLLWNQAPNASIETKEAWEVINMIHGINESLKDLRIKLYKYDEKKGQENDK